MDTIEEGKNSKVIQKETMLRGNKLIETITLGALGVDTDTGRPVTEPAVVMRQQAEKLQSLIREQFDSRLKEITAEQSFTTASTAEEFLQLKPHSRAASLIINPDNPTGIGKSANHPINTRERIGGQEKIKLFDQKDPNLRKRLAALVMVAEELLTSATNALQISWEERRFLQNTLLGPQEDNQTKIPSSHAQKIGHTLAEIGAIQAVLRDKVNDIFCEGFSVPLDNRERCLNETISGYHPPTTRKDLLLSHTSGFSLPPERTYQIMATRLDITPKRKADQTGVVDTLGEVVLNHLDNNK